MKMQTGATYQSTKYAKALVVGENKQGKTCALVAGLLGVQPWQKEGGVVTSPAHLHIATMDANALGGIQKFLKETCKAPDSALEFNVYNMQEDFMRVSTSTHDYDDTFFIALLDVIKAVDKAASKGGVHAFIISSLTGAAHGIQRALFGPPTGRGQADQNKWALLGQKLNELQRTAQQDKWHTLWEAHLDKKVDVKSGDSKEGIQVQGSAGKTWAYNVEQVFRFRRSYGQKFEKTNCDKVALDTRPSLDFIANGRGFNESLDPSEPDITAAFRKLGLSVGGWKADTGTLRSVQTVATAASTAA